MLKENKVKVILSSVIILLPALFGIIMWDTLPNMMTTHWGTDGNGDSLSGKAFAVFGLPIILLVSHILCLFFTALDKKQKNQNKKALGMIFWIIPFTSLFSNGIVYAVAFGKKLDFEMLIPAMLGLMFIFIGNYLPKIKQNRTLGIKISWTLNNEENWNKTHRFSGKLWVIGGLIMLFSIFLPSIAMVPVLVCVIIAMIIIPIAYSYSIYKKHQKEEIAYVTPAKNKTEKIAVILTAIIVPIILISTAVSMFTGNIEVQCGDTSLQIRADYWTDLNVQYSEIESVSYREELDAGTRTFGFGSPRLAMGNFQNDEFGSYTLYTYGEAKAFVVLTSSKKTLVIGLADTNETQELYNILLEKIG